MMETGTWVTTGKGKNQTTTFQTATSFNTGDNIVIRAHVVNSTGLPIEGVTVDIDLSGPEAAQLVTGPSDAQGWAEVTWNTQGPNKKGVGGTTPGEYTATTVNATATGYSWDGVQTAVTFTLQ